MAEDEAAPLLDGEEDGEELDSTPRRERDPLLGGDGQFPLTRHIFALMGFLGFVNVYAMRVNLSVAIVAMINNTAIAVNTSKVNNNTCPVLVNTTEVTSDGPFNWGAEEQGWLLGAFFVGYVVTQLPGGRMAEVWGGKTLYGCGVLITAVFTLITPWAANTSIYLFVLVRVLEGLGEGVTFPAMHAMMAVWVPPNERSRMAGFIYSGSQAGTVLSLPISGLLCDYYGWPSVFYVFGSLGIVWWLAWLVLVSNSPSSHPRIDPSERRYIISSLPTPNSSTSNNSVPWISIFTSGPVYALIAAHLAQNYGFYTLLTELPTYMANVLHFNIKANSFISALPYLAMLLVANGGTRLADHLLASGWDRTKVRKMFNSLAMFFPAIFLVSYSGCDNIITISLLCLAVGFNGFHYAGFMCTHLDLASNYAGTLLGITNGLANLMGIVAPAVAGEITQGHSDIPHWRLVFFIAAVVYLVGNTIFLVWGSTKELKWNRPGAQVESELEWEQDDY